MSPLEKGPLGSTWVPSHFGFFFILWIDYEKGGCVIENVGLLCSEFDRIRGGGGKPIERHRRLKGVFGSQYI